MKLSIKNVPLIFALLLFPPILQADSNPRVIQWAQQTLMNTLSVSYTTKPSDFNNVRKNYSLNAWTGITEFLGGNMNDIRAKQLTLHPILQSDTQILSAGLYSGMSYWIIRQSVNIEELNTQLTFTLTILGRTATSGSPYIVQSLSISKSTL